eukprot:Pgem_evm1s2147
MFNDDGTEDEQRRGQFPLVYNETKKRMTPMSAIRVIKERRSDKVIFSVPRMIPINHDLRPGDVVSMDP